MKSKPGRWVHVTFTEDQNMARKIWRKKEKLRWMMADGLRSTDFLNREEAHKRLDRLFDTIEKQTERSLELFPEVDESFTVASFTIDVLEGETR